MGLDLIADGNPAGLEMYYIGSRMVSAAAQLASDIKSITEYVTVALDVVSLTKNIVKAAKATRALMVTTTVTHQITVAEALIVQSNEFSAVLVRMRSLYISAQWRELHVVVGDLGEAILDLENLFFRWLQE
jgi:hypothetical protein